MGKMYPARYLPEGYFKALELLNGVAVRSFCVPAALPRLH
jgi:hypothetical protein